MARWLVVYEVSTELHILITWQAHASTADFSCLRCSQNGTFGWTLWSSRAKQRRWVGSSPTAESRRTHTEHYCSGRPNHCSITQTNKGYWYCWDGTFKRLLLFTITTLFIPGAIFFPAVIISSDLLRHIKKLLVTVGWQCFIIMLAKTDNYRNMPGLVTLLT